MHYSYPWEKFSNAIYSLAGGGPLRDRIHSAFMSFLTIQTRDFADDPDIQAGFSKMYEELTKTKAMGDEGNVRATLNAMNDDELASLSASIVDIHLSIARARLDHAEKKTA
jgi:hypothetical protein